MRFAIVCSGQLNPDPEIEINRLSDRPVIHCLAGKIYRARAFHAARISRGTLKPAAATPTLFRAGPYLRMAHALLLPPGPFDSSRGEAGGEGAPPSNLIRVRL